MAFSWSMMEAYRAVQAEHGDREGSPDMKEVIKPICVAGASVADALDQLLAVWASTPGLPVYEPTLVEVSQGAVSYFMRIGCVYGWLFVSQAEPAEWEARKNGVNPDESVTVCVKGMSRESVWIDEGEEDYNRVLGLMQSRARSRPEPAVKPEPVEIRYAAEREFLLVESLPASRKEVVAKSIAPASRRIVNPAELERIRALNLADAKRARGKRK